ncbi:MULTISPECIES: pantoate--beta-alanine ligase [Shewanella]|uniref:pantoate--beta-alanine ligase n=1 Tax=Shewanella TaxID=22 RepID=UPI00048CD840|nr:MULTISPECIES: pantoate--beta-alanine ligase [Shewanella]QLE84238.1 pantoate--beta-alanine ligase [Shewanella sp. Scap07]
MLTTSDINQIRTQVRQWRQQGERVAFVPTMGNLHQGHISLIEEAKRHADHVVASIFVNPMQFGQNEDLDAYPRTLANDQQALSQAGAELLFTPTAEIIYPKGLAEQTFVDVPGISEQLCGQSRPGHFRGVATVVCKLFNIVQPDVAVFGEKDFQQLMVIKTMVEDLSLPISIVGVATKREASGLAMSSRNGYLSSAQKQKAAMIKQTLDALILDIKQGMSIEQATISAQSKLQQAGFEPDYLAVRNANNLATVAANDTELVVLVAAYMGKTRLIDNLTFSR